MNMQCAIGITLLVVLLNACTDTATSLGTMEGHGAFVAGDTLMLFGADRNHRLPDGTSFSCADDAAFCRRAFLVAYDKSFKRTATFEKEMRCTDLAVSAIPRSAGGWYLVAVDRTWVHRESETSPSFHVTVSSVSTALEEEGTFTLRSTASRSIHATFVTAAGDLFSAGMSDADALFLYHYDAETGEPRDERYYPGETGGRIVFFAEHDTGILLVRRLPEGTYRILHFDHDKNIVGALTIAEGDTLEPAPTVGARGIAAIVREDGLYWLGADNGLFRFVPSAGAFVIETFTTLDAGELSYQRDLRFLGGDLYVFGANDRISRGSGCGYDEIATHETELVLEKFDSSFNRLWEDRETEAADYRALEIVAWGKIRYFLFQKNDRVIVRVTD